MAAWIRQVSITWGGQDEDDDGSNANGEASSGLAKFARQLSNFLGGDDHGDEDHGYRPEDEEASASPAQRGFAAITAFSRQISNLWNENEDAYYADEYGSSSPADFCANSSRTPASGVTGWIRQVSGLFKGSVDWDEKHEFAVADSDEIITEDSLVRAEPHALMAFWSAAIRSHEYNSRGGAFLSDPLADLLVGRHGLHYYQDCMRQLKRPWYSSSTFLTMCFEVPFAFMGFCKHFRMLDGLRQCYSFLTRHRVTCSEEERLRWEHLRLQRLVDDICLQALSRGIRQVVLLGSGFDTRPFRLLDGTDFKEEEVLIVEVDQALMLEYKGQKLSSQRPRCIWSMAPLTCMEELGMWSHYARQLGGFDSSRPAVFVLEACLTQVPALLQKEICQGVACAAAPGSAVVGSAVVGRHSRQLFHNLPEHPTDLRMLEHEFGDVGFELEIAEARSDTFTFGGTCQMLPFWERSILPNQRYFFGGWKR
eukprot:TRINITY_DN111721_c0_g1_i1.p1 TRINITY_DN111721_c0_g1~~TRINITY_DN111721_c0_g1_i1.p1  ORF type:complete len:480 (+),score=88.43 TRINITY_DN111721_c0_g1_i1:103-1542(+)